MGMHGLGSDAQVNFEILQPEANGSCRWVITRCVFIVLFMEQRVECCGGYYIIQVSVLMLYADGTGVRFTGSFYVNMHVYFPLVLNFSPF